MMKCIISKKKGISSTPPFDGALRSNTWRTPHLPTASLAKILAPSSRSRRASYLTCLPLELPCLRDSPPFPSIYSWIFIPTFCSWKPPLQTGRRGATIGIPPKTQAAVVQKLREQNERTPTIRRSSCLHFYAHTCPNAPIASPVTPKKGIKLLDPRYLPALWIRVY